MPNSKETYLNIPLAPEIKRELAAQADENTRSTGREGALIITNAMRRRIARTQKHRKDEAK
jgi:hypothetical protein